MEHRVVAQGPFALKPSFARDQWGGGIPLFMLFLFALGPGFLLTYFFYNRHLTELEQRWAAYQPAAEAAKYEGRIYTSKLLIHQYELKVSFNTQDGKPISVQSEFTRLLTGPDSGDDLYVRFDPAAPEQALTSWEYESVKPGRYWANAALALGVMGIFICIVVVRDVRRRVAAIAALARDSQLVVASVERLRQFGSKSVQMLQITFRMPSGAVQTQVFQAKLGQPYFVNGTDKLLVLSSLDERNAHIVREDGYPLAERPSLK